MTGLSRRLAALSMAAGLTLLVGFAGIAPAQTSAPAKGQVPVKPQAKTTTPATPKARPIDLNTATAEEMIEALPGVGEATARKIIAGRPYRTIADLERAGVPARTIEAIRPLVVVSTPTTTTAPATTKAMTKPAATPKTTAGATSPAARVNLNTATVEQLQELPGVGPVAARAIVAGRPYRSVDDLEKVRGIGEARIAALRNLVTVGPPAGATTPTIPATTPAAAPRGEMTKSAPATKGAPATKATTTPGLGGLRPGQIVNINTAPKEQLDLLPGIGPVKAQAIIEGRPFKTKEDIMKVKGIKEGEFSRIKDLITVN